MADYKFYAFFTASRVGKAGLTVTADVYRSTDDVKVVSAAAVNEIAGGLYSYAYTSATPADYVAVFKTADTTVDMQEIAALVPQQLPATAQTGEYSTALTAIQADLDNHAQYKADVSSLATQASLNAVKAKTDQLVFANQRVNANASVDSTGLATEATQLQILGRLSSNPLPQLLVSVAGSTISDIRGNDWAISISGVTLTGKIQFAIKKSDSLPDSLSEIFVDSVTGLIVQKGLPSTTPQLAQLTYSGDTLTIVVDASVTAQLAKGTYVYGIQSVSTSGEVLERYGGKFVVQGDVVRATS